MPFLKNTAVTGFPFALVNKTTGAAVTTGTVTGYYTLDGGAQGTVAASPAHLGNGQWEVDLAQGEMNGDVVGLVFTHADALPAAFTIRTDTQTIGGLNNVSRADITGGAYAIDTDANGRVRLVVGTGTGEVNSSSGKVPATIAAGDLADNSITAAALATDAVNEIVDATWDEATSGHTGSGSFGKLLSDNLGDIPKIDGTINDASATTTSFVVASSLSSSDDFYVGSVIAFTTGTLAGIARRITDYVGSSRTATVSPALPSAPANGVEFIIIGRID